MMLPGEYHFQQVNTIQLFNGSAGNRSKYFSRGIGKDESVLLPEVNDRG